MNAFYKNVIGKIKAVMKLAREALRLLQYILKNNSAGFPNSSHKKQDNYRQLDQDRFCLYYLQLIILWSSQYLTS